MQTADLTKLNRILGMLGSDNAGERAAAALAADRLVKKMGTNWWSLLGEPDLAPRRGPRRGVAQGAVRTVSEWGIEHQKAADARLRQARAENERLEKEVLRLRRRLSDLAAQQQRLRLQED
jgi:hypothetical protein